MSSTGKGAGTPHRRVPSQKSTEIIISHHITHNFTSFDQSVTLHRCVNDGHRHPASPLIKHYKRDHMDRRLIRGKRYHATYRELAATEDNSSSPLRIHSLLVSRTEDIGAVHGAFSQQFARLQRTSD